MERFLTQLLDMRLTATWLALVVMGLRLLLKRAPRWIPGLPWAFVALRLLMPFSLESPLSLMPQNQALNQAMTQLQAGPSPESVPNPGQQPQGEQPAEPQLPADPGPMESLPQTQAPQQSPQAAV